MTAFAHVLHSAAHRLRQPDYPVAPVFLQRWSPRAFQPRAMPKAELYTILEAARWAPSAYNIQPWRFIHALRGEDHWHEFVDLLDPFNAGWARKASALVFVVSDTLTPVHGASPARRSQTHSFDAGAAWAHMALQATILGYQAHAMAGIRSTEVRQRLAIPDRYRVEIGVAIGRQADPAALAPALREREKPSLRLPLGEIAFARRFVENPAHADPATTGGSREGGQ